MPRTKRADLQRDVMYTPPGELTLPDGMEDHYRKRGYHLRWIRAEIDGQDDIRNITMRQREGYQLINKNELEDEFKDFFDTRKVRNNTNVVCIGDLVLGKIEIDRANARQEYYEKLSSDQVTRARTTARDGSGDGKLDLQLERAVPLEDQSSTTVNTGSTAAIED